MIIYDLEIQNAVPSNNIRLNDVKYCKGWDDHVGMGLACLCLYDYANDQYRIFDEFELDELKTIIVQAECIVGFNHIRFDNKVLQTYDVIIPENRCYDILREIARADGTPDKIGGLSLNAVCQANFNISKNGDGANAPVLYQNGAYGKLYDYCLNDVRLTKRLLDKIIRTGRIINPRTGKEIFVRKPGA